MAVESGFVRLEVGCGIGTIRMAGMRSFLDHGPGKATFVGR